MTPHTVVPAQAGTHTRAVKRAAPPARCAWIPAFAGMTAHTPVVPAQAGTHARAVPLAPTPDFLLEIPHA